MSIKKGKILMGNIYTQGDYKDEIDQVHPIIKNSWLDYYFHIYHDQDEEFINIFLNQKIDNKGKSHNGYVDFVLTPKPSAINDLKWKDGCIQIECKPSQHKIGKPIAQCLDYQNSIIKFKKTGLMVKPSWTFLFPVESIKGDISSVMTQNKLGYGSIDMRGNPKLKIGEKSFLSTYNGEVTYNDSSNVGNKQGSR
jgi:hypothetical protein